VRHPFFITGKQEIPVGHGINPPVPVGELGVYKGFQNIPRIPPDIIGHNKGDTFILPHLAGILLLKGRQGIVVFLGCCRNRKTQCTSSQSLRIKSRPGSAWFILRLLAYRRVLGCNLL
jgi:hypothetical protein